MPRRFLVSALFVVLVAPLAGPAWGFVKALPEFEETGYAPKELNVLKLTARCDGFQGETRLEHLVLACVDGGATLVVQNGETLHWSGPDGPCAISRKNKRLSASGPIKLIAICSSSDGRVDTGEAYPAVIDPNNPVLPVLDILLEVGLTPGQPLDFDVNGLFRDADAARLAVGAEDFSYAINLLENVRENVSRLSGTRLTEDQVALVRSTVDEVLLVLISMPAGADELRELIEAIPTLGLSRAAATLEFKLGFVLDDVMGGRGPLAVRDLLQFIEQVAERDGPFHSFFGGLSDEDQAFLLEALVGITLLIDPEADVPRPPPPPGGSVTFTWEVDPTSVDVTLGSLPQTLTLVADGVPAGARLGVGYGSDFPSIPNDFIVQVHIDGEPSRNVARVPMGSIPGARLSSSGLRVETRLLIDGSFVPCGSIPRRAEDTLRETSTMRSFEPVSTSVRYAGGLCAADGVWRGPFGFQTPFAAGEYATTAAYLGLMLLEPGRHYTFKTRFAPPGL